MQLHVITGGRKLRDLELENKFLRDALQEYASRRNWDGAGQWIHPSYSTEIAELALDSSKNLGQRRRKPQRFVAWRLKIR